MTHKSLRMYIFNDEDESTSKALTHNQNYTQKNALDSIKW